MRELNRLREQVGVWQTIGRALSDARELAELGDEDVSYTHLDVYKRQTERIEHGFHNWTRIGTDKKRSLPYPCQSASSVFDSSTRAVCNRPRFVVQSAP